MPKRILVLGSTGNVGVPLVRELARMDDVEVHAASRNPLRAPHRVEPNVRYFPFDFAVTSSYRSALTNIHAVYLLTPVMERSAEWVREVLSEARKAGVSRVVRQSAFGVTNPQAARVSLLCDHLEGERLVEESGIPSVILRPMGFFQNFLEFAESLRSQDSFSNSMGSGASAFIDARDVAAVGAVALTQDGMAREGKDACRLELTGPERLTGAALAATFTRVLGRTTRYIPVADHQMKEALLEQDVPVWQAKGLIELYRFWREGYASEVTSEVEKITGFPARTFGRFVRESIDTFREGRAAA